MTKLIVAIDGPSDREKVRSRGASPICWAIRTSIAARCIAASAGKPCATRAVRLSRETVGSGAFHADRSRANRPYAPRVCRYRGCDRAHPHTGRCASRFPRRRGAGSAHVLVDELRRAGQLGGVVMEGRDIAPSSFRTPTSKSSSMPGSKSARSAGAANICKRANIGVRAGARRGARARPARPRTHRLSAGACAGRRARGQYGDECGRDRALDRIARAHARGRRNRKIAIGKSRSGVI